MKREYIEKLPAEAIEIKHKIITCDNPNCETVIKDRQTPPKCVLCDKPHEVYLTEHIQTGNKDGSKLLDFCSEKCLKKITGKWKVKARMAGGK